jgi:ankyrin repeat protein
MKSHLVPSIHPFSAKHPNVNEIITQLSTKYQLSSSENDCLELFTNTLTIITKENFYHELLTDINVTMWWNHSTALMIAVHEGNFDIVRIILKMGAKIDLKNSIGNTALMIAAERGEIQIFDLLYKEGADLNCSNKYGQTALMLAIERNRVGIVNHIIDLDSNQLECRNVYNKNPLLIACEFGKFEIAKAILSRMKQSYKGDEAAMVKFLNTIHTLEDKKASSSFPAAPAQSQYQPQSSPQEYNSDESRDPSPSPYPPPKHCGNTPLMFACRGDTVEHEETALLLLRLEGININWINKFGDSSLSWAALAGRNNVITSIIKHPEFKKPSLLHMAKILENLCSFDFADLSQSESTVDHLSKYINATPQVSKQMKSFRAGGGGGGAGRPLSRLKHTPSFHNMSIREVNHEESLKAVLEYIQMNYRDEEVYKMKYQCIQSGPGPGGGEGGGGGGSTGAGGGGGGVSSTSTLKTGLIHGNIRVITLYFLRKDKESDLLSCGIDDLLTISEQKEMLRRLSLRKDSLQLLVRLAALYNLHFEILKLYLRYIENSVGLLDTELPIFYKCLYYGCLDNLTSGHSDDGGVYIHCDIEEFELPDTFINFPKHLTHVNVVDKLVELSLLFKTESYKRPMERIDLLIHVKAVDNMLLECFKAESFASKETMQRFLENHCNENSLVRLAHAFMRGPLARCIRHKTSIVFNSGHINSYVNKLYWGYMRDNSQNHIIQIRLQNNSLQFIHSLILKFLPFASSASTKIPKRSYNLIECKSNLIFLRFNPSCMYFLEGLAKGILLGLLVYKVAYDYHYQPVNTSLVVMILSMVLYEYGEICDNKFISIPTMRSINNYFTSIWNLLDDISFLLVLLGMYSDQDNRAAGGAGAGGGGGGMSISEDGRGYYSVAVIFSSISMLNYFGAYEPIGQLLIMVFAMTSDLMKFVFIFIFCIFGFCVAMFSLQTNQSSGIFSTRMKTFLSLFDAALLNYTPFDEVYLDHDRYYILGIVIEIVYIVFTAIVLLNLIIARMSATHDQIHKKSFEEWQYTRAFTVYSFLLLNERSPYSMLPPPFNLIPTFFSFWDYLHLWWLGLGNGSQQQINGSSAPSSSKSLSFSSSAYATSTSSSLNTTPLTTISISGTASDWVMGIFLSFLCPIFELFYYLFSTLYNDDFSKCYHDILFMIGFFPLLYPLYVISLIIQTLSIVTRIDLTMKKFSKKQFPICFYETQLPDMTPPPSHTSPSPSPSHTHGNPEEKYSSPALQLMATPSSSPPTAAQPTATATRAGAGAGVTAPLQDSTIDVKVIRVIGMIDFLHKNHLPIVQIQIQNVVNYCGNCIREGTTQNFVYSKSLLQYPIKQLHLESDSIEMSIFVLDKDILTGRNDVIAAAVVPSNEVREWIANGRYEGKINFIHGRGAIQVVIATCILKGQHYFQSQQQASSKREPLLETTPSRQMDSAKSYRRHTGSLRAFMTSRTSDPALQVK